MNRRYRSSEDNLVKDFYIPVLETAIIYKRAVGYFSSTALFEISKGLAGLLKNQGSIMLITSPYLQETDIEAINKGYEDRSKIIEEAIMKNFFEPRTIFQQERFNLLAYLIANKYMDIKVAFMIQDGRMGLYHEKIGIIYDNENNKIAFTGSLNESNSAFSENFESIDIFCSWKDEESANRVEEKEKDFDLLWSDNTKKIQVIEFPAVAKEKLLSYRRPTIDLGIDEKEEINKGKDINIDILTSRDDSKNNHYLLSGKYGPHVPNGVSLYDYQLEAIDRWQQRNFKGIFDMATGTGKTYTGLAAICRLWENIDKRLLVIVVCPYQHLVEQWVEDIKYFNIKPIIGYSSSPHHDWKKRLEKAIRDQKLNVRNKGFACFICTNATFASVFVQEQISKIKSDSLVIIDEAHYFGASRLSSILPEGFKYRLALSATLERHRDEEGTNKLKQYFGEKCIEYSIERAIQENKLTQYKYYPLIVNLSTKELEVYEYLSKEISKCIINDKRGNVKLSSRGEMLALKRARLVAAAESKLHKLREVIEPYTDQSFLLVYCGAASLLKDNDESTPIDEAELRQIDAVTRLLGDELNMKVSQFTSREDINEREILKKEFEKGENLQALIAIKCLDEGVNIPKIKTAFILASTTNPKEYIQRRGRVLRRSEDKEYAEIYDFVTIPRPLNEVSSLTIDEMQKDLTLIRNELNRVEEFARISMNSMEADSLVQMIKDAYFLKDEKFEFVFS